MTRGLKLGFRKKRDCTTYVAKTKVLISCVVTVQLICIFIFAYVGFLMMALILLESRDKFSHKKVLFTAGLDFDIRLVNGTETLGRVEVKINNEWGTVCGTDFTKNEAVVICKQLGFFDGVALEAGNHGGGSGEVILNGITCTGRESTLKDCVWSGYKQTSGLCDHSKDAAVRCYTNCELHLFTYILQLLTFALFDSLIRGMILKF